jgi:hypothetical protein
VKEAKKTVPGLVRTPRGVAEHVQAVQDRQWDSERKVFRDPITAILALYSYARLTATLLHEAEERFAKRVAEFEIRLAAMERWRADAEAQTADMVKGVEEMMAGGPAAFKEKMNKALELVAPPSPIIDAEIRETNNDGKKKKNKDGAA